jgi:beta-lactamase class A
MEPAFVRRWAYDDAAIADGEEQRSWTWGPTVVRGEPEAYAQSPDGKRNVWYLDKARMEVTHPEADPDGDWYVTSGLLTRELISGQMQVGDNEYETWPPAAVPVAGDLEAAADQTITYADLHPLASINGEGRVPAATPDAPALAAVIAPGGKVAEDQRFATYDVHVGAYDDVLGHNIAKVFLDALPADALLYIAGRPLTEPYWARVLVAHEPRDVLIQAFERRVLTFTPSNPEHWQVEWGNVGRQYLQWRYGKIEGEGFSPNATVEAAATARNLQDLSPAAANIANSRAGNVGVAVYSTATGAFYSFQGSQAFPMWSTAKVPIMLAVLDLAVRQQRGLTAGEQSLIQSMIQVSDNGAATTLINGVGGAAAVNSFLRRIGITNTNMNSYAWGASTTTAQDMARLMAKLAGCTILTSRMCRYALQTMQNVVPGQKWGVSGGVPAGATVALKNGWYPDIGGWGINSVGLVTSKGKQYAIAVFTNPNPSMQYGIDTIQQISAQVYPTVR